MIKRNYNRLRLRKRREYERAISQDAGDRAYKELIVRAGGLKNRGGGKMKGSKYRIPPLEELTEEQKVRLEQIKKVIFEKVGEIMGNSGPTGGLTIKELDWKMGMVVQGMVVRSIPAERGLVLLASEIVMMRVRGLLRMALRTEAGKEVIQEEERLRKEEETGVERE